MATLPGLTKGVTKDPTPPAADTEIAPITIPDGTILVTTKTTNETIDNVDQLIDYVSGDNSPNFIPQLAIENLVFNLALKEDIINKGVANGYAGLDASSLLNVAQIPTAIPAINIADGTVDNTEFQRLNGLTSAIEEQGNKGAVSGYAGLDASQELLLANFPSGTGLQILRRDIANGGLEFFTLVDFQGITSINADITAAQLIVGTTNVITVGTAAGLTTVNIDSGYVGQTSINTVGVISTGFWMATAITGEHINAASTDLTDTDDIAYLNTTNAYVAGTRQDFLGLLAGTAGLNVGPIAGNPTTQMDGDVWLNTSTNQIFGRINGVDVDLGAGVGEFFGPWTANHDAGGFDLTNFGLLIEGGTTATAGVIRLGNNEEISWRNSTDDDNDSIGFNNIDNFRIIIESIVEYQFTQFALNMTGNSIQNVEFFESVDANPADTGVIRLGNSEEINWRNNADDGNLTLTVNILDEFVLSGDLVMTKRFHGIKGADVVSAATITLGDGNYFDITGNTNIDFMSIINWQVGSQVTLQFDSTPTVNDNTAAPPQFFEPFNLAGNFVATAGDTLTVIFDGAFWREISRSVN